MSNALQEGVSSPKDFELKSLDFIASDGKALSIVAMVLELTLHQSIDAPVMFGSVVISDGRDLLANFFGNGNEYLKIAIDQSTLNSPIERTFRIYKITERTHMGNSGAKYIMHFVSQEAILSAATSLSKSYKGKTNSQAIADILGNILGTDKVNRFEQTTGVYNYVIPSMRPFEAIQWLASRSYSTTPAYGYHFFESRDGFEFMSLQGMFKQNPVRKLIYDIKNVNAEPKSSSDVARNRDSLQGIKILHDFDVLRSIAEGSYASSLLDVNLLTRDFKISDYSLLTAESQQSLLNQYKSFNDEALLNSVRSNFKVYISTSDTSDEKANEIDKWLMTGKMHRSLINSYRIKTTIAGDITLRPGDVIEIKIPKFIAADEEGKELDLFRSGKYVIADLTHVFRSNGTVDSVLEVVSDSFSQNLPSAKDLSRVTRK